MLLGGFAKMNFWDFFIYYGKPSIFFAVELGAVTSFFVLYWFFRKEKEKSKIVPVEKINSYFPTILLVILIVLLALSSFFPFDGAAGTLCILFGIIALTWKRFSMKSPFFKEIRKLDWETTFFLAAVFVLVGSLTLSGWVETFALALANISGGNILFGYIAIVAISVVLSAFVDNVPFLMAMLPVAMIMAHILQINPSLLLFGLLIGTSLGGNITPIGASANIVACGILKEEGYEVKFGEFVRIGLPFTIVAVTAASLFVWWVWR